MDSSTSRRRNKHGIEEKGGEGEEERIVQPSRQDQAGGRRERCS